MATFSGGETLARVLNFHFNSLATNQGTVLQNFSGFVHNNPFYEVPAGRYAELTFFTLAVGMGGNLRLSNSTGNVSDQTPFFAPTIEIPIPGAGGGDLNNRKITLITGQKIFRFSASSAVSIDDEAHQFMIKEFNIPA